MVYCDYFHESQRDECHMVCKEFVKTVNEYFLEFKEVKIHLLLHLVEDMTDFGPTSAFNTKRYNNNKSGVHVKVSIP